MAGTATAQSTSGRTGLTSQSCVAWIEYNRMVQNKGYRMEWIDHPWLIDIIDDPAMEVVVEKAAQIGLSTAEIFRVLHKCVHMKLIWIYVLPTDELVYRFTPAKLDPIIRLNKIPCPRGGGKESKSIGAHGESMLFITGSWGTRQAIMLDADGLSYDEVDQCNPDVLETFETRIQASRYGWKDTFSTPTVPNKYVDAEFSLSDQKHWFIWCPHCGESQTLTWPDSVDYDRQCYACIKCRGVIEDNDRREGVWVAKYPNREVSGYHVSQMMAPWISAGRLIRKEATKSKGEFHNYYLGLPYAGSDISVSEGIILKNIRDHETGKSRCYMGCDVGLRHHHYVIGNDEGIFEMGTLGFDHTDPAKGFDRIANKIREHDIRCCVVDGRPDTDEARELAGKFPFRVYLNFYTSREQASEPFEFDDKRSNVLSDRQRTLTDTINEFYEGHIGMFVDPNSGEFRDYCKQWTSLFLKSETDKYGQERKVWESVGGNDHYAHATNYYRIALKRGGLTLVKHEVTNPGDTDTVKTIKQRFARLRTEHGLSEGSFSASMIPDSEDFYD